MSNTIIAADGPDQVLGTTTTVPIARPQTTLVTVPVRVQTAPVGVLQTTARVRFIHNMTNGPLVNIWIDGKKALDNVPYPTVTDYLPVSPDTNNIIIRDADDRVVLYNGNVTLRADDYTVIIHGSTICKGTPVRVLVLNDDHRCPKGRNAKIRFIHAAADAPPVNVYVNKNIVFKDVKYGQLGQPTYVEAPAGVITLDVTPANSQNVVIGPLQVQLSPGKIYTVIASGAPGNAKAPLGVLFELDNRGVCYYN